MKRKGIKSFISIGLASAMLLTACGGSAATSGSNETIQNCKYCRCSQKSNKNNDISHGFSHLKKRPQIPFGFHERSFLFD